MPREEHNLAADREAILNVLLERMEREVQSVGIDPNALDIPPELEERLRALGY